MFDPYKKWLGIPPKDQPPNHYRLLGLELYESDLDVIEGGADRVMGFLRQYQSGENATEAAKLLNEVATARICLLKPGSKAEYDAKLHKELDAAEPEVVTKDAFDDFPLPAINLESEIPRTPRRPKRSAAMKKGRRSSGPPWIPIGVGAVIVVLVVAVVLGSRASKPGDRTAENSDSASAANQSTSAPASTAPQPSSVPPSQSNPTTTQTETKEVKTDSAPASSTSETKTEIAAVKIPNPTPASPKESPAAPKKSTAADQKGLPKTPSSEAPSGDPSIVYSDYLIEDGKWGPNHFCQGVSLAETPMGIVAAFWGGSADKSPDLGIWVSRRGDDLRWTAPVEVASVALDGTAQPLQYAPSSPVLFAYPSSKLELYYRVGDGKQPFRGVVKTSEDHGKTWSNPTLLPEGFSGPSRTKPYLLPDGKTLLFANGSESSGFKIHFEFFDGKKWTKTSDINDGKNILIFEPTLLSHGQNRWQVIGRSIREHGRIFQAWSPDGGKHWSKVTFLELPNPSSPVDAIKLNDGRFLMVYNHSATVRTPLNLAFSQDGVKWDAGLVLESDGLETSHPSVIQTQDGLVHLAYPRDKKSIRYRIIDPEKVQAKPIVDGVWPTGG